MTDTTAVDNYLKRWEEKAMVRTMPRRTLPELEKGKHYFPMFKQPLSIHPLVMARGDAVTADILLQSCYKYMEDIALTETEVVCRITTRIANGRSDYEIDRRLRQVALTIVTDENYHAYVARDFMDQLGQTEAAAPLDHPSETELSVAMAETMKILPPELHGEFEFIAVAIAENTLTREIVDLRSDKMLDEAFRVALADHLGDEAQHSGFFQTFLSLFWRQVSPERRAIVGRALPGFLSRYLGVEIQQRFDFALLNSLGFSAAEASLVVEDCHDGFELGPDHPMMSNILRLLQSGGILDDPPTRAAFVSAGFLPN